MLPEADIRGLQSYLRTDALTYVSHQPMALSLLVLSKNIHMLLDISPVFAPAYYNDLLTYEE